MCLLCIYSPRKVNPKAKDSLRALAAANCYSAALKDADGNLKLTRSSAEESET